MTKASSIPRRLLTLLLVVLAILVTGWVSPASAAGRSYDEAPMQVQTKGFTAEQHLQRQAELSRRLARELPLEALDQAGRVSLTRDEITAVEQNRAIPLKIGVVKPLETEVAIGAGQVRRTAEGGLVWATTVRAEGAGAVRLHVQDLALPLHAELYIYSRTGLAYGPYTGSGPDFSGDFWAPAVFGPEAIVQLRLSRESDLSAVSLRIAEAGLITERFAGSLRESSDKPFPWTLEKRFEKAGTDAPFPCDNQNCVVDATCSNVGAANPAKLATAKMEWVQGPYIYTCTGGLLSDNNPSQGNFFLTANHCLSSNKNARNASFYWRFATSSCNGTCPVNGGWPYVTTGATVAASNRKGDFTLMQLTSNPPAGSVFLGWTSAPVANTNGAQLYRISNPNFGPQVYSQHNVSTSAGTCQGWPRGERIYSRDITGATDGGSSGSPVLNAASQVVGQLSGGCGTNVNDPCDVVANATVDGALAYYYSTVRPFLNP